MAATSIQVEIASEPIQVSAWVSRRKNGISVSLTPIYEEYPTYEGSTDVTASDTVQVLPTNGLLMPADVTIHPMEAYNGTYTVTPGVAQTLPTNGKRMISDVNVSAVGLPYADVSVVDATAADVSQGKIIVNAHGQIVVGTLSQPVPSDVNFYDYDGTLLYSYTAEQFLQLTSMPPNPSHEGLTAQGWNWSLADAKAQVEAMGACDMGQMYLTSDGKTHIHVTLTDGTLSLSLGFAVNGTAIIDWGDNTGTSTITGTNTTTAKFAQHVYANAGNYDIKIQLTDSSSANIIGDANGSRLLSTLSSVSGTINSPYQTCIRKVFLGERTNINSSSFRGCGALESVTIPSTVTAIGSSCFYNAFSIKHLTLPINASSIPYGMCYGCYNLRTISMSSGTISFTSSNSFYDCRALSRIVLHRTLTRFGTALFYVCSNLTNMVIPSTITELPASLFTQCYSLTQVTISDNVTTVGNSVFYYNQSLTDLTIPAKVTSIGSQTFMRCYGLQALHFKPLEPPSVLNANAFTDVPTSCIIYVPSGQLSAYKSADNYPNSETYTYVEE